MGKMKFIGKRNYEYEFAQDFLRVLSDHISIFRRDSVLSGCIDLMITRLEQLEPSVSSSSDIDHDYVFFFSDSD